MSWLSFTWQNSCRRGRIGGRKSKGKGGRNGEGEVVGKGGRKGG